MHACMQVCVYRRDYFIRVFYVLSCLQRCKLTAVDQSTGEVDKFGPLEILRSYRAPLGPAHACFGQLLIPLHLGGVIRVGDEVTVLQTKRK